jgi:hypothetical protein
MTHGQGAPYSGLSPGRPRREAHSPPQAGAAGAPQKTGPAGRPSGHELPVAWLFTFVL